MKKVLLSIVASTLFFNTIYAEELEVLENNEDVTQEVEETINNEKEIVNNESTKETVFTSSEEVKTYVAQIGDTKYETFDEAVTAAVDGDTIKLLDNATTKGLNLSKNLTIDGSKEYTLTFEDKGIALWEVSLTFKDVTVNIKGIGSTPYTAEWNWMTISASKKAALNLENAKLTLDGTGTKSNVHAIYFGSNNKLNLNNSTLIIKNYTQDALEWNGGDGGYNVNLVNSTYISDNNRQGFTGTFYATIDNSTVEVLNSSASGSNGTYYTIKNNSKVTFENNNSWGISAWRIDMTNNSTLNANNNGYSGIWTRVLNVDKTCTLIVNKNGTKAPSSSNNAGIFFQGNKSFTSTIEEGAKVEIKNNAGSGIYTKQSVGNLTILSGEITNNGTGSVNKNNVGADFGGGIYNVGTLVIGNKVNIYNNHASKAADDIYNKAGATIEFKEAKKDWVLDDCDDKIDGWYDDNKESRWNAHDKENKYVEEVESNAYETELTIKAAHGIYGKLIVRYVDNKGNVLSEELTSEKVGTEYATIEKEFEDYSLIDIDGETKGKYIDGTIIVTYIYEFTSGTGGDDIIDIPNTGIETNNVLEITTILSLISLITSIIIRKRFN